jgi:hypothetical protein
MFLWTGEFVEMLERYEKDRQTYSTLESFMPRVAEFFDAIAPRIPDLIRAYEKSRPKVTGMNVTNGAKDVDPKLAEIVIRFDRPMLRRNLQIVRLDPACWPKLGEPRFDASGTALILPVTLEPGHEYEFALNTPTGGAFASVEGVPLEQVIVHFRTRTD